MKNFLLALFLLALAACGAPAKDYDAINACRDKGLNPGAAGYDHCINEEEAARMLKQQQQEFDQMKQDERDWKLRRY